MESDGTYFYRDVEYGQANKSPAGDSNTSVETKKQTVLKNVSVNLV